jgi:hypothetical protein
MAKKKNINVTFGYRAVITVSVKAENDDEARKIATNEFNDKFRRPGGNNIIIEDDSFKVSGILNMDETWDML